MAPHVYKKRPSAVGSILKLLAAIALELVSCVEARMPFSPDRIEAMRSYERDLGAACSGWRLSVADSHADDAAGSE
jgi:hypothetical protein